MRKEMFDFRESMRKEMFEFRESMRKDMSDFKDMMRKETGDSKESMRKDMYKFAGFLTVTVISAIGVFWGIRSVKPLITEGASIHQGAKVCSIKSTNSWS
jgi:hypothetical protein